jgi:hypothetical protein
VVPDVSEEHIASIFRVVELSAKQRASKKKILFKTTAVKTSNPTWFPVGLNFSEIPLTWGIMTFL